MLASCIGEGNGNPFQSSCLEKPRDWGAWWASIYGVAQSRTQLKQLSSSSSSSRSSRQGTVYMLDRLNPSVQFSSVQSFSHVRLFATPWTVAHQPSLSITNSWSLLKLMSIKLVMPSNHRILCCPLLLLPSIFLSIRVSSSHQVAKYWSFSFSISSPDECSGLISFRMDWLDLLAV